MPLDVLQVGIKSVSEEWWQVVVLVLLSLTGFCACVFVCLFNGVFVS